MTCGAVRQSDEMFCPTCNLRWDVSDPEPPTCREPGSAKAWVEGCKCRANGGGKINPKCPVHGEPILEKQALQLAAYLLTPRLPGSVSDKAIDCARTAIRVVALTDAPFGLKLRVMRLAWFDFPQLHRKDHA